MGAFDHLPWTEKGAFENVFGLGRGEFEQKFSKNSNAREGCGGGRSLSFNLTGTLPPKQCHFMFYLRNHTACVISDLIFGHSIF